MKTVLRAKLLTSVSAAAIVVTICAADARAQSTPPHPYSFNIFVQGGYAISGGNDTPFAEIAPGTTPGTVATVDSGNGFTGKVGGGVHLPGPWSAQFAYTGLRTDNKKSTGTFPSNSTVVSVLAGGRTFGGVPGIGTSWARASVVSKTHADVFDFQAGYDVGLGAGISGTILGGVRFGSFNQETDVAMFTVAGSPSAVASRHSRFEGIGPTLGFKGAMPLVVGWPGLGIEGSVLAGALFGDVHSTSTGAFIPPTATGAIFSHTVDKHTVSPNAEAELALTYTLPMPSSPVSFQLAAGYQVMFYGHVRDTANGASRTGTEHFGSVTDDLLYHGPFARLQANF
jgi:hypothetical protein